MTEASVPATPVEIAGALSALAVASLEDAAFTRDGPRENFEYRDLGLAAATAGRITGRHSRAIKPFEAETGWHWHAVTAHIVYVLKGELTFRFEGRDDAVTVRAGSCINQPPGVPHNVVGYSDDLEVIELQMPADAATVELD